MSKSGYGFSSKIAQLRLVDSDKAISYRDFILIFERYPLFDNDLTSISSTIDNPTLLYKLQLEEFMRIRVTFWSFKILWIVVV